MRPATLRWTLHVAFGIREKGGFANMSSTSFSSPLLFILAAASSRLFPMCCCSYCSLFNSRSSHSHCCAQKARTAWQMNDAAHSFIMSCARLCVCEDAVDAFFEVAILACVRIFQLQVFCLCARRAFSFLIKPRNSISYMKAPLFFQKIEARIGHRSFHNLFAAILVSGGDENMDF